MGKTVHDQIAEKLARKFKTDYKSDKGIDREMWEPRQRRCLKELEE